MITPQQDDAQILAQRIEVRTQQLVAEKIGMLVIGSSRVQAEAEVWAEKAKADASVPKPPEE